MIRPFTARWHKKKLDGAFSNAEECETFRAELKVIQKDLISYTQLLADMARVEDLTAIIARNSSINILSVEELAGKIEAIKKDLKSYTWRHLETNGKFTKNDKLSFISDEMLIVGCDIGSETHYIRAIDTRGRELSREAFSFSNNETGFAMAREWILNLAAISDKKIVWT